MSETVISARNIFKSYTIAHQLEKATTLAEALVNRLRNPFGRPRRETFRALKDVSFEIKQGEVVGVIGRNGAGKSTLLKILSQITQPTSGEIDLYGRVGSLLEVGTGFHPELTGRENIFLNGAILGMSRREIASKFDEIAAFAEVDEFLDTPVKRYSSGMYVRLAFAVAAHLETEILLVDEVLAVGDIQFQKKCLGKIEDVSARNGRTILFVSHSMAAVRRLCGRAMLLENGTTRGIEEVESAIERYTRNINSQSVERIDLSRHKRSSYFSATAKITGIRLPPGGTLRYGEPLEIILTVQSEKAIEGAAIGFGFDNSDGTRILTLDTDNDNRVINLAEGIQDVIFRLPRNPLHPGFYRCGAAILSGRTVIDAVTDCIVWEVLSGERDLLSDRGVSGCRLPFEVEVRFLQSHDSWQP